MSSKEIYRLIQEKGARVVTDSRLVKKGDIFFALSGDTFDGNSFASQSLSSGAIASIIDNPDYYSEGCILISNVLDTLQEVANIHRKEFDVPVLAITGTNGKTTTKELISRVLSKKYTVHSTRGNLNNHIGVPLTILETPEDSEILIVEMGANHIGEIKDLCEITEPNIGIVTNIGKAHLEGFGSFEGVVEAKSELYKYLNSKGGVILYNDNNPLLTKIVSELHCKLIPYSKPGIEYSIDNVSGDERIEFSLDFSGSNTRVRTQLFGKHNIENITAAIAVGLYFNIDRDLIVEAISNYSPDNNRSQVVESSSNTLLCDAYNANPDSMMNALESFMVSTRENKSIILGDMLELGDFSLAEHKRIVAFISGFDNIKIFLVGSHFMKAADETNLKVFADVQNLINHLESFPIQDSFVLLKGSRGISLEKLFPLL